LYPFVISTLVRLDVVDEIAVVQGVDFGAARNDMVRLTACIPTGVIVGPGDRESFPSVKIAQFADTPFAIADVERSITALREAFARQTDS